MYEKKNFQVYISKCETYYDCNQETTQQFDSSKREWRLNMSSRNNRVEVPEAREAMDNFKYEVASELGVPLKHGYNGDLTSYQNGSVGGYMVKKMIQDYENRLAGK